MPDLMQHVCDMHPELTVCASVAPASDLHPMLDQAYFSLVVWLGGLGADRFWILVALALGCCVAFTLLTLWTALPAQPRSRG